MRRLVLPTLAIATSLMLVGAPLTSSAADYLPDGSPPTGQPDTPPTAEAGYPGILTYSPDAWTSGPVKTNMTLIERVRQRIEQAFPDADISVMANADQGVVTLMGLVATKEEKERAHEVVAHTKGVTEVHDEIQVSG